MRCNAHHLTNIDCRHLEYFGEAEFAVGLEVFLTEDVVLVLGPHHHRGVLVRGPAALRALQARLVEEDIRYLHRVFGVRLK